MVEINHYEFNQLGADYKVLFCHPEFISGSIFGL